MNDFNNFCAVGINFLEIFVQNKYKIKVKVIITLAKNWRRNFVRYKM